MRRISLALLVGVALVSACTAFAPSTADGGLADSGTPDVDDRTDASYADEGTDAGTDSALQLGCDPDAAFGDPQPIPGVNLMDGKESAGSLTPDELQIFFAAEGRGADAAAGAEIYGATRSSTGVAFGAATLVTSTSSPFYEANASLSPDGLTLAFESELVVGGDAKQRRLYTVSRAATDAVFGSLARVFGGEDFIEETPYLTTTEIYFSSHRNGTKLDLFHAQRVGGTFDSASVSDTPLERLNADASDESYPVITSDGLTLYFTSNVASPAKGDLADDLYVSHRKSVADAFDPPQPMPGLAQIGRFELAHWVTPDGCRLYITVGVDGNHDSYFIQKPPAP